MYKKYLTLVLAISVALCSFLTGCKDDETGGNESTEPSTAESVASEADSEIPQYTMEELGLGADYYKDTEHKVGYQLETPDVGDEIAIIHTTMGDITLRFFPEASPNAVENFISLAEEGYYDGIIFHRVIDGFMIQSGDPTGTGTGGESINGEDFEDEFSDKLFNIRGSVAMANSGANTNGSQFFINQSSTASFDSLEINWQGLYEALCQSKQEGTLEQFLAMYGASYTSFYNTDLLTDDIKKLYEEQGGNPYLDGAFNMLDRGHTVFAQVIDGMDVVDAIASVSTDGNDKPIEDVIIEGIDITTYEG